jgi:hypothetical protein
MQIVILILVIGFPIALVFSWAFEITPEGNCARVSTISCGQLKLTSYWDPLRGDPRFEKIVASLAPKE